MHVFCPAFIQTKLYQSESYRPDRYANKDDAYYEGQEFLASQFRTKRSVDNGLKIDSVGMTIFKAIEENKFYILTQPEALVATKIRYKQLLNLDNPITPK